MQNISETIVFFGSGPVAAESLALLAESFSIEAVVTKPQPTHHKEVFPVLATARKLGLKTLTPANKVELSALFATRPVTSRVGVVIDYGIIISQQVIDYFPLGIINSHFSLLPRWRGADPISFAILNGDKQTGVSLMLIVAALDEGPLLAQAPYDIPANMTTPELTRDLIEISAKTLAEVLPLYTNGQLHITAQNPTETVSYSRKLTKADGQLDFQRPAVELERQVRAFVPWPGSQTKIGDKDVTITASHVIAGSGPAGKIYRDGKTFGFYTTENILIIDQLKPSGRSEMASQAFLAGYGKLLTDI